MIRVLIVDDSLFMRTVIKDILKRDTDIEIVGVANNGKEALDLVSEKEPDIVTLDIEMPIMDGLETLREIMKTNPIPVLMFSALTKEGAETTIEALELGAIDYIPKPSNPAQISVVKNELVDKVKEISKVKVNGIKKGLVYEKIKSSKIGYSNKIITIGASTGGPKALTKILSSLPKNIPPTLIVQHMPKEFIPFFAERLDRETPFKVKEAEENEKILHGHCFLAPGDWHMAVRKNERIHLHKGPQRFNLRPTVDEMMISAAQVFGDRNIGVILTGMGDDGTLGMMNIKKQSGTNIAQDEATSVIFGMPKAAIDAGVVDIVLPLEEIPIEIVKRCE